MDFDSHMFRRALGTFATGITVVTSVAEDGELLGFTANSFNSVSMNPPLVLFSLNRNAFSLRAFEAAGVFAINVLSQDQEKTSVAFARALANKWDGVPFETWDTGCPILSGALANFECETATMHDGGDHVIFVGRVLRLKASEDGKPLIYFRGCYRQIDPSV